MPLDVILTSAAREPAHNNGCGHFPLPDLTPPTYIKHIRNNNRITKIR